MDDNSFNLMNENENRKVEIKDALTCFICTAKVYDPMMCPQCKKLVCAKCIKKWFIDQQHEKCPYCQVPCSFDKMINLPFMNQLSEYFIKEIEKKEDEVQKTFIAPKSKNMNINQIIDGDDEDDNFFNMNNMININNNKKSNNNYNDENNLLSRTQLFPHKFQKDESFKDNNYSLYQSQINNDFNINNNYQNKELCPVHRKEPIEYYCSNCNTKHCAKCLLIMSKESKIHQGHKIIEMEKKNKYNLDTIYEAINSLSNVNKELNQYKINIEMEEKIIEKREDFYKKMTEEFQGLITSKILNKKTQLSLDKQNIINQLKHIDGVKNNHKEAIMNFVERDDELGLLEYHNKIKGFRDTEPFVHNDFFEIYINPSLRFFETDFMDIEIKDYEDNIGEIIGELNFDVNGLNKQIQLRFNQDAIDEILINLQINLDNLDEEKIRYSCYLILRNKNLITSAYLNESMVHNGILILGKTIVKNSLKNILDDFNKCHFKLIISEIKI